jgi:hypothetical protein
MSDKVQKDVTVIYEKVQKDTAQSLTKYNANMTSLIKKSKEFWKFTGVKEALFWSMSIAIIVMVTRGSFEAWGLEMPMIIWGLGYPASLLPLLVYAIGIALKKE